MNPIQDGLIRIINTPLFKLGPAPITLLWIVQVTGLLLLVSLLASGIKRLLKNIILKRLGITEGNREAIAILLSWSLGACGYIVVFQAMGLQLESFAVVVGGLGVGIGLGLKELTKNWASGLTILGERKLKVGDLIEFNGKLGHIKDISIRSTVIATFRGSELIVPNSELTNKMVENWSYQSCLGRLEIPLRVPADSDLVLVTEVLLEAAFSEPDVLKFPTPRVIFQGFGDLGLELELWAWVDRVDRRALVKSALNFAIAHGFQQHQIAIASGPPPIDPALLQAMTATAPPIEVGHSSSGSAPQSADHPADQPPDRSIAPTQPERKTGARSLRDRLQAIRYFSHFSAPQLGHLIQIGYRQRLEFDDVLFKQGDRADTFCVVLSGAIDAIFETQKISRRLFSFEAGQFFGELPLMLNVPYPTTMRAAQPTELFLIHRDGFRSLLVRHPELLAGISAALAERQDVLQGYRSHLDQLGLGDDIEPHNLVARLHSHIKEWIDRLNTNP
jgi:small-conductance mechanosensitive channel/CRP-like cAMP-binding protein